jgi:hypothetical protein
LAMAAMTVARSGDGSDRKSGAEGTSRFGEGDIALDWGTRSAEVGERQRPWSLAAVPMAALLWSVRERGRRDCGQHDIHINARRSRARVQGGRGAGARGMKEDARQQLLAMVERALLHERHGGINANTWWAIKGARWELVLGRLRADFGLGPRSKFGAHSMLYNFR